MGEMGMQREFWGNSAFSALPWINQNLPPGSRVDFHDTTWGAVQMYRRAGFLRRDITPVWDYKSADAFLFHWHKEFTDIEADARSFYKSAVPGFVWAPGGVPLLDAWVKTSARNLGKTP